MEVRPVMQHGHLHEGRFATGRAACLCLDYGGRAGVLLHEIVLLLHGIGNGRGRVHHELLISTRK
jgi:hypothetical protein